ncbi:MAG: malate dehydrogenase [Candidatus Omnitrophica bacterium]|nr:malate dehydrogenase [Candidatus Omnitrophota bacterium]
MSLPRVTVIGAGQVGATTAHLLALKGLADITLIDVVDGLAKGKALDMFESAPVEGFSVSIRGTTDLAALAGSRLAIITAGLARKPGMSRDDLLLANANIVGPIAERIAQLAPEAVVIVVTNPLDMMVALAIEKTKFPRERVMGMAGVLDSARLRAFVAERLQVAPRSVEAMVLGSHGDLMVPLPHSIQVDHQPIDSRLPEAELAAMLERTKNGGAEIVNLLKQGSAFYAPASSAVLMAQAILNDTHEVLPACALLHGEYGLRDVCIGVPVQLGAHGIERVVELPLSEAEHAALAASARQVSEGMQALAALQAKPAAPAAAPAPAPTAAPIIAKGLEGVVAGETAISDVDGQRCQLVYRGYNIDELIGKTTYEEVSYLLLFGALPTRSQLADWTKQLDSSRALEPQVLACLQSLPYRADPMGLLRTAVSFLGLDDPEADAESAEVMQRQAVRTIAKMSSLVAAIARIRSGAPLVPPKSGLAHAANFLYMLHGEEPSEPQARALDAYFILLADHSYNASTFAARVIVSTRADYYSAVAGAIGALKGSLHGAANRKAMEMLLEIGGADQVETYVHKTLADHKRFMGFGHRVYKGEDPRAKHLKAFTRPLGQAANELKWYEISERLQEAVFKAKGLYINVDFYSASLLHYLGIPTELFTTMFAVARSAGWSAHIIEQAADNRLIRPLAAYIGPRDLKVTPLAQRK